MSALPRRESTVTVRVLCSVMERRYLQQIQNNQWVFVSAMCWAHVSGQLLLSMNDIMINVGHDRTF